MKVSLPKKVSIARLFIGILDSVFMVTLGSEKYCMLCPFYLKESAGYCSFLFFVFFFWCHCFVWREAFKKIIGQPSLVLISCIFIAFFVAV